MARINVEAETVEVSPHLELADVAPFYNDNPVEAKVWAQVAWMNKLESTPRIAELIGVAPVTVRNWITKWKKKVDKFEAEALESTVDKFSGRVESVLNKVLTVLDKSASHILENNVMLNVDQFKGFVSSAESLYKMKQLEEGKPTEIYSSKNLTWEGVLVKLKEVDIVEYDGRTIDVKTLTQVVPEAREWQK